MEEYPIHGQPQYGIENDGNPYNENRPASQRGEPYMTDLAGRSTMVSDSVEMTRRLKMYVPAVSAKGGGQIAKGEAESSNYKAKYQ